MIGDFVESYQLNIYPKETKHDKFYFFDHGVARAASGIKTIEEVSEKKGFYLESLILNELKVYRGSLRLTQKGVEIFPLELFIDFLWKDKILN